ncbi:hypothetical protein [Halochromatium glycolicum]|nr:hypothetical protein [Halochromatium glycolicum]
MPTIPANADPKSQAAAGIGTTAGGAAVPVSLALSMAKQSYLPTLFF